jgi:hypothetical protein
MFVNLLFNKLCQILQIFDVLLEWKLVVSDRSPLPEPIQIIFKQSVFFGLDPRVDDTGQHFTIRSISLIVKFADDAS